MSPCSKSKHFSYIEKAAWCLSWWVTGVSCVFPGLFCQCIDAMYPNVAMLKIRSSFLLVVCSLTSIGKREPGASLDLPFPSLLGGCFVCVVFLVAVCSLTHLNDEHKSGFHSLLLEPLNPCCLSWKASWGLERELLKPFAVIVISLVLIRDKWLRVHGGAYLNHQLGSRCAFISALW